MKKIGFILFITIFLLMCLFPLAGMLMFGPSQAAANEILADPPSLKTADNSLNFRYLNDVSDYFADHFAGRQELITANAVIESAVFRESASEKVILGKDGWLYYKTTLDDYQGQNQLSDREIWAAAHTMYLIQEYAQTKNANFLFTVVPNKNMLYPQQMPSAYIRGTEPGNLERLSEALQIQGVSYLDLYAVFSAEHTVLYHKLDSHWNNLGAALAHDAILAALGRNETPSYQPEHFTAETTHDGDLYQMLYPAGTQKDIQMQPDWEWRFVYDRPIRSAEDQTIYTGCEGKDGKLLMFRDSFGNTLHPFMAESFGAACFSRAMPYDLTRLDAEAADTLVIEIVQRNISWLAERAPTMVAPTRQLELPQIQTEVEVPCTCTQAGENLFCYTGNLPVQPDIDSPIYMLCDGKVYEATPAGEGENPFTAYLTAKTETEQIIFVQNGEYVISQPFACEK